MTFARPSTLRCLYEAGAETKGIWEFSARQPNAQKSLTNLMEGCPELWDADEAGVKRALAYVNEKKNKDLIGLFLTSSLNRQSPSRYKY